MKIKLIGALSLFVLLSSPCFAANYENTCVEPYNKPLSIFLSVVSPGMGQIYSGQLDKGLAVWAASQVLTASLLITVADLDFTGIGNVGPINMGFRLKQQLSPNERFWTWGLSITYVLLYTYNVLDISLYDTDKLDLAVECEGGGFHLNYCLKF